MIDKSIHDCLNIISDLASCFSKSCFPYDLTVTKWQRFDGLVQDYMFDGLLQDCSNSSALAVELLQSCSNPPMYLHC